jgi:hypothetical protein
MPRILNAIGQALAPPIEAHELDIALVTTRIRERHHRAWVMRTVRKLRENEDGGRDSDERCMCGFEHHFLLSRGSETVRVCERNCSPRDSGTERRCTA